MIIQVLVVALLLTIASVAHADVIGPVCWTFGAFPQVGGDQGLAAPDLFRLFFIVDPAHPNVASVAGQDDLVRLPVTGSAYRATGEVVMVLTLAQGQSDRTAVVLDAEFALSNLKGSAVCQGVNPAIGGCGEGYAAPWTPIACP
jgi:hypothetical protein